MNSSDRMSRYFPERLRQLRQELHLTQQAMADALGIGQTTVANYEKGIRLPDLMMIGRIADYFLVSVDYLLGREHKRRSKPEPQNESETDSTDPNGFEAYLEALLTMDKARLKSIFTALCEDGISLRDFYRDYVTRALYMVGDLWGTGDLAVWKEHYISETMIEHMAMMKAGHTVRYYDMPPILALVPSGSHTIALRMISNLLEEEGFPVLYLGSNVPADNIMSLLDSQHCELVLMSVTMPYDVNAAKLLIESIRKTKGEHSPRILIGGQGFRFLDDPAVESGADAYCRDLADIIEQIKLMEKSSTLES